MVLERRLADYGYLEAVRGLTRREEETGTPCTEVLDGYNRLQQKRQELEKELAVIEQKLAAQQDATREAEQRYRQLRQDIEQAKQQQQTIQTERKQEGGEGANGFQEEGGRRKAADWQ